VNAARPGVLPALSLALAAGLDVERFGDGRRAAGLAEAGLAVGALMFGEDKQVQLCRRNVPRASGLPPDSRPCATLPR